MKVSTINSVNPSTVQFLKLHSNKKVSFNGLFKDEQSNSNEPKFDKEVLTHAEELKKYCTKTAKNDAVKLKKEGHDVLKQTQEFYEYCQSVLKNQSEEIELTQDGTHQIYSWTDKNNNHISVTYKNNSKGYAESIIEVTAVNGRKDIILDSENGFKVYRGFKGSFKDGYEAEKVYKYGIPLGKTKKDLVLYTLSENVKKSKIKKSADRSFNWDVNKPDNVKYITEGINFEYKSFTYKWPGCFVNIDKRYGFDPNSNTLSFVMENIAQNPRYEHRFSKDYQFNTEGELIDYCDTTNK